MGQWVNPPLDHVAFRLGYPLDLGIEQRVTAYQREREYVAEMLTRVDEKRPHRGAVPHFFLQNPADPKFTLQVTHNDAYFEEKAYSDWVVFRDKILNHLDLTPVGGETQLHDFIGLVYVDRLSLFPHQDMIIPIEKYLRISMKGTVEFSKMPFQRAAWETDYQMRAPNDLMRVVVQSEPPDADGIEHLVVSVDRRIVGIDRTPAAAFLDLAHQDTKHAFESLLQPEYLQYLKEGTVPDGSDFSESSSN